MFVGVSFRRNAPQARCAGIEIGIKGRAKELAKLRSVTGPKYFTRNPKVKYSLKPSFGNPQLHVVLLYCVLRYKTQMTMLQPKGWPSGCRFSVPRYAGMGVVVVLCLWAGIEIGIKGRAKGWRN